MSVAAVAYGQEPPMGPVYNGGSGYANPSAKRKRRAPTPPDAIVISSDDSDDEDAVVSRRGPVYATRSRPALPKSSASLMAGRLNEAAATGYKSNNSTYFPWANGNGGFQVLPGHAGHAQGYYAVPTVAGPGNDRSHVAYASPSTLHLQTGKPRRSEVSVANTSKRLKKQQSSDQVYSVDSDDVEATSATAVQSSSSTTAIPSKETSSSKARAPSCDDKEGHYNIIPGQHIGPRNRYKIVALIGQGTFGKVVKAWDCEFDCFRAVKIIRAVKKYREASYVEIRVLKKLKEKDPRNEKRCIHLVEHFDHCNHVCMVFDLLDKSIFDFLKENEFNPFPYSHIKEFAYQLLRAVAFLHDELQLVHTDLKPENLMLVSALSSHTHVSRRSPHKGQFELHSTEMRLIDFGSATFDSDYHSSVVSTRHYRAPEIILGMRWSFPCDVWSVGCILVEFFTGDALFQTHDNLEHLAMMQTILGDFPKDFVRKVGSPGAKFFRKDGKVDYPSSETSKTSIKFVRNLKSLQGILSPTDQQSLQFFNLIRELMHYDPAKRITAARALRHPFFNS